MPDDEDKSGRDDLTGGDDDNKNLSEFTQSIPESFRDKAYMKDITNMEDLLTKFDGAETLIGKNRTVVPGDDASDEDITNFYKTIGRPEKAEDYDAGLEEGKTDELFDKLKPAFHESGLTQRQAKKLLEKASPILQEIASKSAEADTALNKEFDDISTKYLGANQDTMIKNARVMIDKHVPAELAKQMGQMDNKSLLMTAAVLNHVHNAVYKESDDLGGGDGGQPAGVDALKKRSLELSAELQKGGLSESERESKLKEYEEVNAKRRAASKNK